MVKSKEWNWELIDNDSEYWNTPAPDIYYLSDFWVKQNFKEFLDIGCGFGRNAIYMAKKGFNVSTFDLSKKSVEITKQKAREQNVVLKNVCVADMLNMPFKNNSFDCLIALNVISHTNKKGFDQILSEIKRVLKQNGEAYFTVGSKDSFGYNNPDNIYVDEWTKIKVENGPENGIPHFYINDDDCKILFNGFIIKEIRYVRTLKKSGKVSAQYYIWLKNN